MERHDQVPASEILKAKVFDLQRKVGLITLKTESFFLAKIQPNFDRVQEEQRLGDMFADAERIRSDATWLNAMMQADIEPEKILEVSELVDELRRNNREERLTGQKDSKQ